MDPVSPNVSNMFLYLIYCCCSVGNFHASSCGEPEWGRGYFERASESERIREREEEEREKE